MDNKISIKNISSATIVISAPELKFRRELIPGRSISISKEDYDELMFDPGMTGLINDHYISITGVEEEETIKTSEVFEKTDLEKILDKQDVTAFAKMIPTAKQAEKDTIVQLAVEKGITHPAFVKLIKQYCDVDVISAINRKHQMEE